MTNETARDIYLFYLKKPREERINEVLDHIYRKIQINAENSIIKTSFRPFKRLEITEIEKVISTLEKYGYLSYYYNGCIFAKINI